MKTTIILTAVALGTSASIALAQNPDHGGQPQPPPRHGAGGPGKYTIAQATSDRAQLNTIAFDGLAFLTGDFCCDTFLPPGKVSDFFGFQNMRDVDGAAMGHNTDFLTRIADNTLNILNDQQKAELIALGRAQAPQIRELALKRFPLIQAFCRNLSGNLPAGSAGLNRDAVMKYTAGNFELSGQLAFERAAVYGKIIQALTPDQKAAFAKLKFGDSRTWPDVPEVFDKRTVPHDVHVAMMTYASEFFSWYAGSVESDTYFCPEGHGTYFGSFYMKDAPAVHQKNYSISTALTGDSGEAFLAALNPTQREQITGLIELQRQDLQDIVSTRRAVATELRKFETGDSADREKVLALCRHYGELDGELSYCYATHFAEVNKTLTGDQRAELKKLRGIEGFTAKSPFVYADPVESPEIENTDFLFVPGT
jgi:Spy/CpxP family protein refolding chaperone